jgi:hypothetical protein
LPSWPRCRREAPGRLRRPERGRAPAGGRRTELPRPDRVRRRAPDHAISGSAVRELGLPRTALVAVVARGDETIPPRGSTMIQPSDRLFVLAPRAMRPEIEDVSPVGGCSCARPATRGRCSASRESCSTARLGRSFYPHLLPQRVGGTGPGARRGGRTLAGRTGASPRSAGPIRTLAAGAVASSSASAGRTRARWTPAASARVAPTP